MKFAHFAALAAFAYEISASTIPSLSEGISSLLPRLLPSSPEILPRANCENTATSRSCWGNYSTDTDWYTVIPDTGVTREYWLSVQNTTVNLDGYERYAMTVNGTYPGPTIIADWGDHLIIHVSNDLEFNGTTLHWHGLRQLNSVQMDGVPGVTQCPIAPSKSQTYTFQATQYGSTWYHSHFSLQYGDGVAGGLVINGPATASYDEDLGILLLSDWSHQAIFSLWETASLGAPPMLENGLINGTNTFDCSSVDDSACVGSGKKFETVFSSGTKYLIRLVNTAVDGHMEFSIDGHELTVIAMDLVPIVPYTTDSVLMSIGQRYDVVVEANADADNYWLRAGWTTACSKNGNAANITGIVRYDSSSTADPTTTSSFTASTSCGDEPLASLVPYLALDVGTYSQVEEQTLGFVFDDYFKWTLNDSSLLLDWSDPTLLRVFNNETIFPTDYNVLAVNNETSSGNDWMVLVLEDDTSLGITHPIHLHGHDFYIIAQDTGVFDADSSTINLTNPPRRDVASLPANGYLAIAFKLDNPGAWLVHCHIAWHVSEGFALELVESESDIAVSMTDTDIFEETCKSWDAWDNTAPFAQDDSGV